MLAIKRTTVQSMILTGPLKHIMPGFNFNSMSFVVEVEFRNIGDNSDDSSGGKKSTDSISDSSMRIYKNEEEDR